MSLPGAVVVYQPVCSVLPRSSPSCLFCLWEEMARRGRSALSPQESPFSAPDELGGVKPVASGGPLCTGTSSGGSVMVQHRFKRASNVPSGSDALPAALLAAAEGISRRWYCRAVGAANSIAFRARFSGEDLCGGINLGHLCRFLCFVWLLAHELSVWRNFTACKSSSTPRMLRIHRGRCVLVV